MNAYLAEACRIFDLVTTKYTNRDGMLLTRVDAESGKIIDDNILVSDFGDYIQNFYYLGKLVQRKDICEWSKAHLVTAARKHQSKAGFFYTRESSSLNIAENADTFEGLSTYYSLSGDTDILAILEKFIAGIEKKMDRKGMIPHVLGPFYSSPLARADYTGNFIEELGILGRELKRKEYFDLAKKLLTPWIENDHYRETQLLPNWQIRSQVLRRPSSFVLEKVVKKNPTRRSSLVKFNTNVLSGVLQLYLSPFATPEEKEFYRSLFKKWSESVEKLLEKNGYYSGVYDAHRKRGFNYTRPLPDNHHVLALYADLYFVFRDENYNRHLKRSLDMWLSCQDKETGLFAENPFETDKENSRKTIIDSNLDLSIVLLKYFQISGERKYLEAAQRNLDAILKYMKRDLGYVEMADTRTGGTFVHTKVFVKYMTLFIKGLILLSAAQEGKDLYSHELFLLARDR